MVGKTGGTFITTNNTKYIRIFMSKDNSTTMTQSIIDSFNIMLVLGTKVAEYEPYLHNEKIHILNDNNMYEEFMKKEEKTILYDNPSGSNGEITLLDDVENYNRLKIFYSNDDGVRNCVEIQNNITDNTTLMATTPHSDVLYTKWSRVKIQKKKITVMKFVEVVVQSTITFSETTNKILITKVEAYKD